MSSLLAGILLALFSLPPAHGDGEDEEARQARLERIAAAIEGASELPGWSGTREELAAALVTEAWFESRFSVRVHRQGPRKDNGGYAISLWSLHSWRLVPYREWKLLGGLDGTEPSAQAAARVLAFARERCAKGRKDWAFATFSLYATGKSCSWNGAGNRVVTYRLVLKQLEQSKETAP